MKRHVIAVAAVAVAAAAGLPAQQPNPLAAAYVVRVGDIAAETLSELLKLRPDFKDPAVVTYEPTTQTIDVEIFASPRMGSRTDQARALLGQYWEFITAGHVPFVERRFGVKLAAQHYRLLYYDRSAQGGAQLVLQFVNGQYLIP